MNTERVIRADRTVETSGNHYGPDGQRRVGVQAGEPEPRPGQVNMLNADVLDALSMELREPLSTIKGAAETLLWRGGRLPSGERHEFVRAIVKTSDRFEQVLRRHL